MDYPLLNMGITFSSHIGLLKLEIEGFLKLLPYPASAS